MMQRPFLRSWIKSFQTKLGQRAAHSVLGPSIRQTICASHAGWTRLYPNFFLVRDSAYVVDVTVAGFALLLSRFASWDEAYSQA